MRDKEKHKQQVIERYYWLKEHHICTVCGNKEAFSHYVVCEDCLYRRNESQHKHYKQRYDYHREKIKRYKAEGKCIVCGTIRDTDNKNYCSKCLEKERKRRREWMRKKRAETNLSPEELHEIRSANGKKNVQCAIKSEGLKKWNETLRSLINRDVQLHLSKKRSMGEKK